MTHFVIQVCTWYFKVKEFFLDNLFGNHKPCPYFGLPNFRVLVNRYINQWKITTNQYIYDLLLVSQQILQKMHYRKLQVLEPQVLYSPYHSPAPAISINQSLNNFPRYFCNLRENCVYNCPSFLFSSLICRKYRHQTDKSRLATRRIKIKMEQFQCNLLKYPTLQCNESSFLHINM